MQTSSDLFTLRTLTDTVLIGPRAAFGRGHRHALQSEEALRQRLTRARIDHGAMQRLRRSCERWRGGDGFVYTTDAALIARVVADTRRGRLAAWVMPNNAVRHLRQPDVERAAARIAAGSAPAHTADAPSLRAVRDQGAARIAAHAVPAPSHPASAVGANRVSATTQLNVAGMEIEDRLAEILRRATQSDRLTHEMVAQLEAMIEPKVIAETVAVLAIWVASHAIGIGFFIDLLLLGSGLFFLGEAAFDGARNLKKFVETAVAARTEAELDLAADLLAVVIVTLGIKVLQAAIRRGNMRLTTGPKGRTGSFDKMADAARAPNSPKRMMTRGPEVSGPSPRQNQKNSGKLSQPKAHTGSISAETANQPHVEKGNRPPYAGGTRARDITTKKETKFVRVHGETNKGGAWIAREKDIQGLSPEQIQDKYALPEKPKYISDVTVPPDTKIRIGTTGAQDGWGKGGGMQYELQQRIPEDSFANTKEIK